jgi:hypothetical protein
MLAVGTTQGPVLSPELVKHPRNDASRDPAGHYARNCLPPPALGLLIRHRPAVLPRGLKPPALVLRIEFRERPVRCGPKPRNFPIALTKARATFRAAWERRRPMGATTFPV